MNLSCKFLSVTALSFFVTLASFSGVLAQKGIYLSGNAGMGYQLFEAQPALRLGGELKWMFLPYLGISIDATMQQPPNRAYASMLSAAVVSDSFPPSFSPVKVVDVMGLGHLGIVFNPVAIVKRDSRHIFSVKLGAGIGAAYEQEWSLMRPSPAYVYNSNDYNYSKLFIMTMELDLSYYYVVYGPLYLGAHVGAATSPDRLHPFYIYGGLSAGLRFSNLSRKKAEAAK